MSKGKTKTVQELIRDNCKIVVRVIYEHRISIDALITVNGKANEPEKKTNILKFLSAISYI